jgi:hypothetical protein
LHEPCQNRVETVYHEISERITGTKNNPMIRFVKDCIQQSLKYSTDKYCKLALREAYNRCNELIIPVMAEVDSVKEIIKNN